MAGPLKTGSESVTWDVTIQGKHYAVDLLHPDDALVQTTDKIAKQLVSLYQRDVEAIVQKAFKDHKFSSTSTKYIVTERFDTAGTPLIQLSHLILGIKPDFFDPSKPVELDNLSEGLSDSDDLHHPSHSIRRGLESDDSDSASEEISSDRSTPKVTVLGSNPEDLASEDESEGILTDDEVLRSGDESDFQEHTIAFEGEMQFKRFQTKADYDEFVAERAREFSLLSPEEILKRIEQARNELNSHQPKEHQALLHALGYNEGSMVEGFKEIIAIYCAAIKTQRASLSLDPKFTPLD
ncbi:MAG: hypothetical protein K940chlam8_00120 [Chlamydiae bacterium]|nr:hypothetical protein [Chlamydiota bacterium]